MKIKTIMYKGSKDGIAVFDREVNEALSEGWQLVRRDVIRGVDLGNVYHDHNLYAELEKPDEKEKV